MHRIGWLVAGLLLLSAAGTQAAPKTLAPEWGNLEGEWRFRTDPADAGEKEGWQQPAFDDAGWRALTAPGYWEPQGVTDPRPGQPPRPKEGMPWTDYDGAAWYRLHFILPAEWAGRDLLLVLGSVDDEDRTFLNGTLVGATGQGVERAVAVQRRYRVPAARARFGRENVLAIRVFDGGGPGGLMGPNLSLLPVDIAEAKMKLPTADRPLAERFADPPAAARILKIIHSWPDDAQAQDTLIQTLLSQGFGGVVSNVAFDQYLESEAKWQAYVRAVKAAREAGMALWLYDEKGYPSGLAGGLVLRGHPEWEARGLLIADTETTGGPVSLDVPPGKLVLAAAFPIEGAAIVPAKRVDLAGQVQGGKLTWTAPGGHWRVMAVTEDKLFEGTHASMNLFLHQPYVNLLVPEMTRRFIELTHQAYAQHLGDDLGRYFAATFTDEPSLMSYFFHPMPYRVLPWSQNLPGEFARRRGRALEPLLPDLIADAGPAGRKARYDYWLTVGELVSEGFFGQIRDWCRKHGTQSGGHLLMEEPLLAHTPLYGDFFRCVRMLDAPSIDCLTSIPAEVPWYIARLVSSAGELEGRTLTMCETSDHVQRYRPAGDTRPVRQVTPDEIRGTCNRLMLGGINTITSYYSFAGLTTAQIRELNLWVGRCSTMLAGGHQAADVALLYPTESVWPRFEPARRGATDQPEALQIEHAYRAASDALYAARRDFTYVDGRALAEAKVEPGVLRHGKLAWRVVVLPCADTLPMAAWRNLAAFVRGGGVVVALGFLPANSESAFPSPEVQTLAKELFGAGTGARVAANPAGGAGVFLPAGTEALLPAALDAVLEPDVRVEGRAPLRYTHRQVDGHELYFLINDSGAAWEGDVSLAVEGPGEQWAPATGTRTLLAGGERVHLALGPYGAALLRFAKARTPARRRVTTGALPGLALRPLPETNPTCGHGEFVQGGVEADAEHSAPGRPAWRAAATLTKSQVDTHLFTSFPFPQGLDLSAPNGLLLDTWVPEGQRTPAQLLVIVRDRDGGDYIASTGRSLALPGHAQSVVLFDQLQLAGWSKDANGKLDRDAIVAISVGWGGYFGKEGEKIEYSVAAPQAFAPAK